MTKAARRAGPAIGLLLLAGLTRLLGAYGPPSLALMAGLVVTVIAPGYALARVISLQRRLPPLGVAASLPALGLAVWLPPLLVGLLVHAPFWAVNVVVIGATAVALAWCWDEGVPFDREHLAVISAGLVVAVLATRWVPPLSGDALFHAGRIRKLLDLQSISIGGISAFHNGAAHAGYAVPLLHAAQAGAVQLTGLEPSAAYPRLVPLFALMAPVCAYAFGRSLGGITIGAVTALFATWDAFTLGGGQIGFVEQPPSFAFVVLVPSVLVLVVAAIRAPGDRPVRFAAIAGVLTIAIVHPTYAVPVLASIAAAVFVTRRAWWMLAGSALVTIVVFAGVWLVALRGAAQQPGRPTVGSDFVLLSGHTLNLQSWLTVHSRFEFVLAMLALVPLFVLWRRRHALAAALMAGPFVLVSMPGPMLAVHAVFGAGQARRLWDGIPWWVVTAVALAEIGRRLAGLRLALGVVVLAVASYLFSNQVPGVLNWTGLAMIAATAAFVTMAWIALRARDADPQPVPPPPVVATLLLTAATLAGSIGINGSAAAHTIRNGTSIGGSTIRLTPGLISYLRAHDAGFPVVLAEPYSSYELSGEANVYVVALPEVRTRAEPKDRPKVRRDAVGVVLSPASTTAARNAVLSKYDVRYVLINTRSAGRALAPLRADPELQEVYRSGDWVLFRRPR